MTMTPTHRFPGAALRAARKAAKLSQQQAADLTNGVVSARAWFDAEKGHAQPLWSKAVAMWAAVGRTVIVVEAAALVELSAPGPELLIQRPAPPGVYSDS